MDEPEEEALPESLMRDLRRSAKAGPDAASRARIEAAVRARTGGPSGGPSGGIPRLPLALALGLVAALAWVLFPRAVEPATPADPGIAAPAAPPALPPRAAVEGAPRASALPPPPVLEPAVLEPAVLEPAVLEAPESEPEVSRAAASERAPSREVPAVEGPSEVELLDAAHGALAQDPGRALTYLERHAALYPRGIFAEEREALAIEALLREGRAGRAASRRARFDAAYPRSPHRARLDELSRAGDESTESTPTP